MRRKAAIFAASVALLAAFDASAAGLSVSPPYVDLKPGQMSAEVQLTNEGEVARSVQASTQSWSQGAGGVEREGDVTDLVIYPKIFTLAPGKTQVVRVGRLPAAPAHPPSEIAYRLTLRELPVDDGTIKGVNITTRLRLPVWLEPLAPKSDWALGTPRRSQGTVAVTVQNRGNVHLRLLEVEYAALGADGAVRQRASVPGWYVLAGAARDFPLELPEMFCKGAARIRATARSADDVRSSESSAASFCGQGA